MAKLMATVHTSVGKFEGFVNGVDASVESLTAYRDKIQQSVNSMTYMVLYGVDGEEITLPGDLIQNSVLVFKVS